MTAKPDLFDLDPRELAYFMGIAHDAFTRNITGVTPLTFLVSMHELHRNRASRWPTFTTEFGCILHRILWTYPLRIIDAPPRPMLFTVQKPPREDNPRLR